MSDPKLASTPAHLAEVERIRAEMQRELFKLHDERYKRGLTEMSRDYWQWKARFDAALERKRDFDGRYPKEETGT